MHQKTQAGTAGDLGKLAINCIGLLKTSVKMHVQKLEVDTEISGSLANCLLCYSNDRL